MGIIWNPPPWWRRDSKANVFAIQTNCFLYRCNSAFCLLFAQTVETLLSFGAKWMYFAWSSARPRPLILLRSWQVCTGVARQPEKIHRELKDQVNLPNLVPYCLLDSMMFPRCQRRKNSPMVPILELIFWGSVLIVGVFRLILSVSTPFSMPASCWIDMTFIWRFICLIFEVLPKILLACHKLRKLISLIYIRPRRNVLNNFTVDNQNFKAQDNSTSVWAGHQATRNYWLWFDRNRFGLGFTYTAPSLK